MTALELARLNPELYSPLRPPYDEYAVVRWLECYYPTVYLALLGFRDGPLTLIEETIIQDFTVHNKEERCI